MNSENTDSNKRASSNTLFNTLLKVLQNKTNLQTAVSAFFVIAGVISLLYMGKGHFITTILFLTGMLIGGLEMFIQGIKNLTRLIFNMQTLMTIAIIGAAIIGEWMEAAVVVVLFSLGEALESYAMDRSRKKIKDLLDKGPRMALVLREKSSPNSNYDRNSTFDLNNKHEVLEPVEEVKIGEHIIIRPGEKIPLDAKVIRGSSAVNQASITGESMPVEKKEGDQIFAGTLNEEGVLIAQVSALAQDTLLANIIHLVEQAQEQKAPAQKFVDVFAKYYTPAIMALAFIITVFPPVVMGADWQEWIYLGLATLVVGCPCALIISTPVAIVSAIGNAARNGVLIKGGAYIEQAANIDIIAFDKTGTLTKGIPEVTDVILNGTAEHDFYAAVIAIEKHSSHPLAKALIRKAETILDQEAAVTANTAAEGRSITGRGMTNMIDGVLTYAAGPGYVKETYPELLAEDQLKKIEELQNQGKSVVVVGNHQNIFGIAALQDEIRITAFEVMQKLSSEGIKKTVMLTGDQKVTAETIAHKAGVGEVFFELLPAEKLQQIDVLKNNGNKVAMIGDGMNDAPALAKADLGIAMAGSGIDTAMETADIVLMGDELKNLPFLITLGRKTVRIIRQNILFALGIKVFALGLVPFGLLSLWIAVFADVGATLIVTLNSMRTLNIKPD